jgi:hypothetical protein
MALPSIAPQEDSGHATPGRPAEKGARFSPNARLASLPENTAIDLGKYESDQLKPEGDTPAIRITDYSRLTYDSRNHQMLMFGGGHASTPRTDVDVFSFTTLGWKSAYPATPVRDLVMANRDPERGCWKSTGHPIARHTYDSMSFAPSTGELILLQWVNAKAYFTQGDDYILRSVKIAHYNPVTRIWRYSRSDTSGFEECVATEYDPVSGRIVLLDRGGLWTYDPVAETKSKCLGHGKDLGYDNNLVYFPPNQRMYLINRKNEVFEVALDRNRWEASSITLLKDMTGDHDIAFKVDTGFAYDAVSRTIGGGVSGGKFYAFDPISRSWTCSVMAAEPRGGAVGTLAFHCLDYDPVNNVFIFLSDLESGGHTWAYRHKKAPAKGK